MLPLAGFHPYRAPAQCRSRTVSGGQAEPVPDTTLELTPAGPSLARARNQLLPGLNAGDAWRASPGEAGAGRHRRPVPR